MKKKSKRERERAVIGGREGNGRREREKKSAWKRRNEKKWREIKRNQR